MQVGERLDFPVLVCRRDRGGALSDGHGVGIVALVRDRSGFLSADEVPDRSRVTGQLDASGAEALGNGAAVVVETDEAGDVVLTGALNVSCAVAVVDGSEVVPDKAADGGISACVCLCRNIDV